MFIIDELKSRGENNFLSEEIYNKEYLMNCRSNRQGKPGGILLQIFSWFISNMDEGVGHMATKTLKKRNIYVFQ